MTVVIRQSITPKKPMARLILLTTAAAVMGLTFSSCATITQEQCVLQNMEDVGFKDGRNGEPRSRFGKRSKSCAKHDVVLDRAAYLRGFERGLPLYCTYDTGFSRGKYGGRAYDECRGLNGDGYFTGYQEGYKVYEIKRGHSSLIASYDQSVADLASIRRALEEEGLSSKDLQGLLKTEIRLEDQREEIRYEIREYERLYDLPRYDFAY